MKRGILSVLIALALCLGLLPVLALAAGTGTAEDPWTCGDGVTAVLDNRTLTISYTGTGTGAMTDYAFSSDRPWNSNMDSILKVVIQEGVTSIGKNAFETSWSLTSVEIPETVTSIGQAAFQNCYKLNSVNLPAGLTSIESNTFLSCKALTSIEIPASVETIGTSAFNASGLTEVTIPEGVTAIGDYAFRDCKSLTTVNIPASVETIGEGAFQGSTKAEIHYPGTTAEWNDLIGSTDIGVQPGKLHTSDSDHTVTISGIGPVTYSVGATVSVSAGTMAGKIFTGWTATGLTLTEEQAASPSFTFIMPANDVTLTASWAEAVAMVDDVGYATVQAAFAAAAQIEGGGTVTLLKNVDLGTEPIRPTAGTVTLTSPEGKKYTLTGSGLETISIMQNGAALKVENVTVENTYDETDMGSGVKLQGVAIMVAYSDTSLTIADPAEVRATGLGGAAISSSGTLKILGGTVIAMGSGGTGVSFNSGTAKVEGGTISGAAKGLNINSEVDLAPANTVLLTGGTFTGTTGDAIFIKEARPNTLGDLVEVGSAIVSADTQRAVDMTGKTTGSGTFTVGCGHASVGTVTASEPENGVVTVTGTCQKCGETVTLGTLTMVNNGLTIAYGDTPTLKVQPSEELGVTKYEWPNKGSGAEYTPNTDALSLGTLTFTCKVTFADQGGTSHDVDVTFTLNVEKLNITNAKIRVLQGSDASNTVPYNGQGQKPAIEGFLINDNGFPSSYFDVSLVDASGTAAETRTNAGTYKIKLTGKDVLEGTVTLDDPLFVIEPATPTIVWGGSVEEYLEYTGKPVALSLTPTVTVAGMDSYDGEAVTYSYTKEGETATQNGLPTNPGTYYIKAAVPQQKNYTAAGTETALKLIITKAAAKITVEPKAANPAYNGKPQALVTAAEASVGEVQYALSADGPWSASIPTATAPGEYTVWYKVDETANYTGVGAQSVKATIGKATAPDAGASLMVKNNQEKTYTLDLSPYLPALPQGQEYGELTYKLTAVDIGDLDYIAENTVSLVDTVLTVPVNKVDKTDEGSVAVITVTIQSDNFQDIRLTVSVTATNKTPLIITGVTAQGWTYDGTVHPGYTGTPRAEGYTGEFLVTYLTGGDKQLKDAGTFSVVFTPMDTENYAGELQLPYTVEQAQVTVTADNKTATVGDELPELTYQVSGLAEGEELKTEPTPACDADMSKAGSYPITFSGAVLPDGGNYKAEIVYQNGTLTVSEKSAPPVNPDDLEIKLEVKEGFTEVPPALRALEHLNTPEKLTQVMRTQLTQTGLPEGNTAVYDVSLMVSNDGGQNWTPATPANFPSGGLTVTLPYPAGTDSTYQFTVVHMFTTTASGKIPGNTESPAVTNTEQGLRFTVTGLSPISVGWRAKTTGTGGSSGGGGGGSGASTYRVTVERTAHGKVTSNRAYAPEDSTVTLTAAPDSGYVLDTLTVTDSRGNKLQLTDKGGGKYAFTMSGGNVTVKAVFAPLADSGACDGGAACPSRAFTDLKSGAWYHEAVDFVLRSGLMNGYGNGLFGPEGRLSRAQFAQILYNKEGRPAGAGSAPFTDVAADAWCAPAVAWAAERGIAGGYGNGTFGPDDPITREQLAVMLWRYAGSPAAPSGELSFMDAGQIGAHAREAICWAVESGVMSGKGGGVLDPKGLATRAHAAQMLRNFLENG